MLRRQNKKEGQELTKKRKIFLAAILASVMLTGSTACREVAVETPAAVGTTSSAVQETTNKADSQSSSLSGSLTLTGSTSMSDVATALAEAFMAQNSDVIVSVGGNGSGEGPTAVNDGTAQIGMLSRSLKDTESPDSFDKYIIGYDGIAVIVNAQSGVDSLTSEQVAKIYTGEITNWKDAGGADSAIQCIGREAASGTRGAFEELMGIEDIAVYAEEQNSTGNVKQAVAANPDAVGYVSISAVDDSVLAVVLDGITLSEAAVKSGDYSLQRPFVMITKAGTTDEVTAAFLDFVFSDAGMKIVEEDGLVPNPGKT